VPEEGRKQASPKPNDAVRLRMRLWSNYFALDAGNARFRPAARISNVCLLVGRILAHGRQENEGLQKKGRKHASPRPNNAKWFRMRLSSN
jgi:hypothetical protein